jgi:CPA2 family monovalent cation:H+ antiporter-2
MIDTLLPVVVILGFGILSVLILPQIGLSPIVGFLLTGVALGHHGLGMIPHNETIHLLAELGVVFLLFDIGLHFSLRHLWNNKKGIFVLGPMQVLLTALVFYLIGLQIGLSQQISIVISVGLALSSTAVASQVISDNGLQGCPNSSTTFSVLIFQDICAIFLLILADTLGATTGTSLALEIGSAFAKCLACFILAILVGKYVLKPVFKYLIRFNNSEVFTMVALLLVLLTGTATASIGLSLTLGAFLAGMIISETPFKLIIQTELRPFRFLLLSLFFMTVGTNLEFHVLYREWHLIVGVTLAIMLVKSLSILAVFYLARERLSHAIQQSALLFQGSEFLLIILAMPSISQELSSTTTSVLIASVAISMALTSYAFSLANKTATRLLGQQCPHAHEDELPKTPDLVILGMNDTGHRLARAMQHFQIPYFAVEQDYADFLKARVEGFPVIYGNKADIRFWENLGVEQLRYLVVARPNIELSRNYAPIAKERFPQLKRYVGAKNSEELKEYETLDYTAIQCLGVPSGLELAERVLSDLKADSEKIDAWLASEQKAYFDRQETLLVSSAANA